MGLGCTGTLPPLLPVVIYKYGVAPNPINDFQKLIRHNRGREAEPEEQEMGGCWSHTASSPPPRLGHPKYQPAASSSTRPGSPGAELMVPKGLVEQLLPPPHPQTIVFSGQAVFLAAVPTGSWPQSPAPAPGPALGAPMSCFSPSQKKKKRIARALPQAPSALPAAPKKGARRCAKEWDQPRVWAQTPRCRAVLQV